MAPPDTRVAFFGDSFVAGVGDPEYLGWVGRVAQCSARQGRPVTVYGLGVRLDTTTDVLRRFGPELAARRLPGTDLRVVVSFGVNDCTLGPAGLPRVAPEAATANLAEVVSHVGDAGVPLLVVGPPPIAEPEQNVRIAELDERFAEVCAAAGTPYVRVMDDLAHAERWLAEVGEGDGAHPAAAGYAELAALVFPAWQAWLGGAE